jgi:hypothetical protein
MPSEPRTTPDASHGAPADSSTPHDVPDTYKVIAGEINLHHVGNRTLSTALLAWFLEAVWRLDPDVASDVICDGGGDKGIDALHVDDDSKEIVVFQSKHRNTSSVTQGDNDLKSFVGTAATSRTRRALSLCSTQSQTRKFASL